MVINSALNLSFPIRWADELDEKGQQIPTVWAYHTPISREVFETNYRVLTETQVAISSKGPLGMRIAALALRDAAKADAVAQGMDDTAPSPLLAEIKRLTMVLAPTETGYEPLPVDVAIARKAIDAEDWEEAEAAIVFFTCGYSIARRSARARLATAYASVLQGSITSLQPLELAASLKPSTAVATSEPVPPSSVPS